MMNHMQDHMAHDHIMRESFRLPLPAEPGRPLSEFNHHLAGYLLLVIGVSAILMYWRPQKFSYLRFVWPSSFMLLGIYLLVYGEPYAWPSGYLSITQSLSDPGIRQHKVYGLLLLIIGAIEFARSAGWLRAASWKYAFPALGALGAIYLLWHHHGGGPGTEAQTHMSPQSMAIINDQHIAYLVIGICAVSAKVLYDSGKLKARWAPYIWPSLIILLGLLLSFYTES